VGLRAAAPAVLSAAALLAACGSGPERTLPAACRADPAKVVAALRAAPGAVTLDGVPLSDCVKDAFDDGDVQTVGAIWSQAADRLAPAAHRRQDAALRLGYLAGATEKGAATTNGIQAELVRRTGLAIGIAGPPAAVRAAYERGLAAGRRRG
jgi:hypothetical protein